MFPDSFGANLAFFALAQGIAWTCLRTGLVPRGLFVLIASWVLADVALVLRFGYGAVGLAYVGSLAALQALVVVETVRLVFHGLRRRRESFRCRREATYREAMRCFLRDELDAAGDGLRALVRADPWDLPARLTLGAVLSRQGRRRAARRHLVGARRLDRSRRYADAIDTELRRLPASAPATEVAPASPIAEAAPVAQR